MATFLVALGANLGDRGETLTAAIDRLAADPDIELVKRSELLVTQPVGGPTGQPDFLNAAVRFTTSCSPSEIHQKLIEVEQQHGRVRVQRWGARKLDLDLLLYDELILDTPQLTLPHPRMSFRRFVLEPAQQVAAEMRHPVLGSTIGQLWEHLKTSAPTVQLTALPGPATWQLAQAVQREFSAGKIFVPSEPVGWPDSETALAAWMAEQARELPRENCPPPGAEVALFPWWHRFAEWLGSSEESLPAPRLIVHWERPEVTFTAVEAAWWTPKKRADLEAWMAEQVARRVSTPLLSLRQADAATAVTEIAAAIQAMQ